jgi:hypothetical protein
VGGGGAGAVARGVGGSGWEAGHTVEIAQLASL